MRRNRFGKHKVEVVSPGVEIVERPGRTLKWALRVDGAVVSERCHYGAISEDASRVSR